jgi:predicted nucleic acid-binding protein
MRQSAYYDSCIFLNAQNTSHRDHQECLAITTPANIQWIVWVCAELVAAETTAGELVSAFEINCAVNGVLVVHATLAAASVLAKKYKNQKMKLRKLQLQDQDFMHLMCAVHSSAEVLTTVDPDFWDAANKRNPGSKKLLTGTKKYIESEFPIEIVSPAELLRA